MLTDEMKAAGWIEHDGGPCPVGKADAVWVAFRDGEEVFFREADRAGACWEHIPEAEGRDDIIAYKPENSRGD